MCCKYPCPHAWGTIIQMSKEDRSVCPSCLWGMKQRLLALLVGSGLWVISPVVKMESCWLFCIASPEPSWNQGQILVLCFVGTQVYMEISPMTTLNADLSQLSWMDMWFYCHDRMSCFPIQTSYFRYLVPLATWRLIPSSSLTVCWLTISDFRGCQATRLGSQRQGSMDARCVGSRGTRPKSETWHQNLLCDLE